MSAEEYFNLMRDLKISVGWSHKDQCWLAFLDEERAMKGGNKVFRQYQADADNPLDAVQKIVEQRNSIRVEQPDLFGEEIAA